MSKSKVFSLALLLCVVLAGGVSAQLCGDADGNATINLIDLVTTIDYIAGKPISINLANADCDGVPDVTISDVAALADNFFGSVPISCSPSGGYSFASANSDTIYVPRILNVPSDVDVVNLLVFGSFSSQAKGIYIPILELGSGSSTNFHLDAVIPVSSTISGGVSIAANERVLFSTGTYTNPPGYLNGQTNLMMLSYERTSSGDGAIIPEPFDRPTPWNIAIARNSDLLVPVIEFYDVTSPNGGLEISANSFDFHALINEPSPDTFEVEITQGIYGVAFSITSSVPWLTASQYTGVTPATVTFLANASGLGITQYGGEIIVSYDGIWMPIDTINVTFTVHASGNPVFPAGDLNCDEALNILDLTHMVDFFFRGGLRPFPCE